MFGDYLKQLRVEAGLTQKELAVKLNLIDSEFVSIDSVTVSRWERNSTAPNPIRAVKVLRSLTNDLRPYLLSLEVEENRTQINNYLKDRYRSPWDVLMSSSYHLSKETAEDDVKELPLFESRSEKYEEGLKNFLNSIGIENEALFNLDLYQHQIEHKIYGKKYINEDSGKLLGHSLSFFFHAEDLNDYFCSPFLKIPIKKTKAYSQNKKMAICTLTHFCSDEPTFWIDHQTGIDYLARHANVHDLYYYAVDKLTADYMINIGAEKVAFDTPNKHGIVKIGHEKYMRCLLKLDSAVWLTRPELLLLLKNHYA
ncbi:helix-turn-helix domain-containing protein [Vibrio jasicida]|uniref:Helix-turn-helix domain-containing protein n=1 Tax=Vibrio jasicida TaxID=766224 RepID=A0ABW7J5U6_9VIBR